MQSNNSESKKYIMMMAILITLPQILFIAMVFINALLKTLFLFPIYYVVFPIMMGIKSYKYSDKPTVAISHFVFWNIYLGFLFFIALYLCGEFLAPDSMGLGGLFLLYIPLIIIAVLVFSITAVIVGRKKKRTEER